MKIKQAFVAPSIEFFKKEFLDYNNLVDYNNEYEVAIFFGAREASNLINNHKGYKIILPVSPFDYPNIEKYENTFFICSDNYILPHGTNRKSLTPRIKDYSMFKPSILGDKIYTYSGFKEGWNHTYDIVKEIQKNINFEIITTQHSTLKDYYDINYLKQNFYEKSFLNLNFSQGNCLATAIELGLMGRKTIFKNNNNNNIQRLEFPNFISYDCIEDIINTINQESKKIGTIQQSIDAHNIGDEWLDLDFWLQKD